MARKVQIFEFLQIKTFLAIKQLHQVSSSSFRESMRAEITTQAFFSQSNLALLPIKSDSASITNAYLPSTVPQWSPQSAIRNHTIRDTRFDLMTLTESWNPGSASNFELEGKLA